MSIILKTSVAGAVAAAALAISAPAHAGTIDPSCGCDKSTQPAAPATTNNTYNNNQNNPYTSSTSQTIDSQNQTQQAISNSNSQAQSIANPTATAGVANSGNNTSEAGVANSGNSSSEAGVANSGNSQSQSGVSGSGNSTNHVTTTANGGAGGTGYGGNAVANGGSLTNSGNSSNTNKVSSYSQGGTGGSVSGVTSTSAGGSASSSNNGGNVNIVTPRNVASAFAGSPNGAYAPCTDVSRGLGVQLLIAGGSLSGGLHTNEKCLATFQKGQAEIAAVSAHADVAIAEIANPAAVGCFAVKSAAFINSGTYDTKEEARAEAKAECTTPVSTAAAPPAPVTPPPGVQRPPVTLAPKSPNG